MADKQPRLRLTVVFEWDTGVNDAATWDSYLTLDPEKCAEIDRNNVADLGPVDFASFVDGNVVSWNVEVVKDEQ